MDALEFLRERKRMCNSYKGCEDCPLAKGRCVIGTSDEDCERIIATVERWSKEHPRKTSDEALKKLQEQIAAWPMTQRFVVQQLIRDYLRDREDLRAYEDTGLTPERCAEFARADAEGRYIRLQRESKNNRRTFIPVPHPRGGGESIGGDEE